MSASLPTIPRKKKKQKTTIHTPTNPSKKFASRRRCALPPDLTSPAPEDLTDFIELARCKKKTGPHGRGMEFIRNSIPAMNSSSLVRTIRYTKNRGSNVRNKRRQETKTFRLPVVDESPDGLFYCFDFGTEESRSHADSLCSSLPPSKVVSCDDFTVFDNYNDKDGRHSENNIVLLSEDGKFIAAKLSGRQAAAFLGGCRKIQGTYESLVEASDVRPNIKRGPARDGLCEKYTGHGVKMDRRTGDLSEYAFKPKTLDKVKERVNQALSDFSFAMERGARALDNSLQESRVMAIFKSATGLPSCSDKPPDSEDRPEEVRLYHTALSIGLDYWSKAHDDEDFYFTSLSVNAGGDDLESPMQNFLFPRRRARFPLRSGEVLLFNPTEQHCSTNARRPDTFIISNHDAQRTARAAAAQAARDAADAQANA